MVVLFQETVSRYKAFVGRKLRPFPREVEITPIVVQTYYVNILQIFPCPVVASQLTEVGIPGRDIVTFAVRLIAGNGVVQGCACLNRKEKRMMGQRYLFVGANEYFDVAHDGGLSVLCMNEIGVLAVYL